MDIEKFRLTEDGRPQYIHGLGTAENPYEARCEVAGPPGVEKITIHQVFDTGMNVSLVPDCEDHHTEIAQRCIHHLLDINGDQVSWEVSDCTIAVTWELGFPLCGRLDAILRAVENIRFEAANKQQERVIERWEMDKLLGRFQ